MLYDCSWLNFKSKSINSSIICWGGGCFVDWSLCGGKNWLTEIQFWEKWKRCNRKMSCRLCLSCQWFFWWQPDWGPPEKYQMLPVCEWKLLKSNDNYFFLFLLMTCFLIIKLSTKQPKPRKHYIQLSTENDYLDETSRENMFKSGNLISNVCSV